MTKRMLTLALAILMAIASLSGCFAEGNYDEHMDFIAAYYDYGSPATEDDMYHYFLDRFNMDIEMIGLSQAGAVEQNTIAISGGSLQDWTMWDFDYNQYLMYVDQGLIRALPDGWEEKWPNVYKMAEASGILPALEIDGKVYAIPHSINVNLMEGKAMKHHTMYYRADWAEQVGIEIGDSIKFEDFVKYIQAVEEAGLTKSGINCMTDNMCELVMDLYAPYYANFRKGEDGKYIWGPCGDGVIEGLKRMKELYSEGILDPDFYLNDNIACRDKFTSGLSATYFGDGTISNYELLNQNAEAADIDNYLDAINCCVITNEAGNFYADETTNYWTSIIFNPELSDERIARILDMTDFVCSLEGELAINMGMPGVDWKEENGEYVILREAKEDGTYEEIKNVYTSLYFFWFQGILPDEFTFINPSLNPVVKERISRMYEIRSSSPDYIPLDLDWQFFAGEAKSQYSIKVETEMARIITDPNISVDDIESEWNSYIESYRPIWEPVVDELNEAFAG